MDDNEMYIGKALCTIYVTGCIDCGGMIDADAEIAKKLFVLVQDCGDCALVHVYRCARCAHTHWTHTEYTPHTST